MQKTKIEWTDYSWNPIKGLCPVGCKLPDGKIYCYGRRIYKRFKFSPGIIMDKEELEKPLFIKNPSRIFVCSTFELFHSETINVEFEDMGGQWVSWREGIFDVIEACPQHTFQILTKFPQNIDRPMPDNVWLGVSITEPKEMAPRIKNLYRARAKLKFISFEPLLGDVGQFRFQGWLDGQADWIIIGRLTGHGRVFDPKDYWIRSLLNHAKKFNTPIFLKNNLKEIWAGRLIQEMPE